MIENEIKPVAWIDREYFEFVSENDEGSEPIYDQSAIDHLRECLAEIRSQRDRAELLVEARGTWIARVTAERDTAVADAERRLQLIRDMLENTEWRHGARNIYAELCKESRLSGAIVE